MEHKVTSSFIVALFLLGSLILSFGIKPAKSKPRTWTVDDDGPADFMRIQDAINAAGIGDTVFVYNGTYNECLDVNKTINLLGNGAEITRIASPDVGLDAVTVNITANNVSLSGFEIETYGSFEPLHMPWALDVTGSNTMIANNIFERWAYAGAAKLSGSHNTFTENEVYGARGILLNSTFSVISYNNITAAYGVFNGELWLPLSSVIFGNNIRYTNMYYPAIAMFGSVGLNVTIADNTMESNGYALDLGSLTTLVSLNVTVMENVIRDNSVGIRLRNCTDVAIFHNDLINNTNQVELTGSSVAQWDKGNVTGGNYWSDGVFLDTDGDGFSNYYRTLDSLNRDLYPLMSPYWYWKNPIAGDVNRDMRVDIKDLAIVAKSYGTYPGLPKWNPYVDLNKDDKVDIKDLALVAKHYGEVYA